MTWGEAAEAAGGRLLAGAPEADLGPLSTDSRAVKEGGVFIALRGPKFDAHDFLDAQFSGWIVRKDARLPASRPSHILAVEDTQASLGALAAAWRARFDIPVIGVTGSNGKTTVKEMLKAALSERGPVCATAGNFNNEIGLPLSVLGLASEHRFAVFEMGAARRGDIAHLCRVARPTAGILTNIAPAHLEFFGDLETVLRTKAELLEALPPGAPAAVCGDDPMLARLLKGLGGSAHTFGTGPSNRVRALPGPTPRLSIEGAELELPAAFTGSVHRLNAAAAAAMASALGLGAAEIGAGLARYQPAPLRFAERRHPSGARFMVDAYNANPASMRAGLETFLETAPEPRRLAVLGDMRELGADSARLHAELGAWLAYRSLSGVYLAGIEMRAAVHSLRAEHAPFPVEHADEPAGLAPALRPLLGPGVAMYFKASRALRLEALAESL